VKNTSEQWDAFLTEMQGQLFFLAGTLLLKRAQKVNELCFHLFTFRSHVVSIQNCGKIVCDEI
jgi:hypothetical protein